MSAPLTSTANDILNRVAAETGLDTVTDPVSSTEKAFIQLKTLLNIAGEELSQNYPWETLVKEETFTTTALDTGEYDLPTDFLYMVNQTGWDRANDLPLAGPLNAQDWSCLVGRNLTGGSIYASFRINAGKFKLLPQPVTAGIQVAYEYVSRNWVLDGDDGVTYKDSVTTGGDTPQFDRTLLSRYVKVKFLEAKGFDSTKAQADLNQSFALLTARDQGAPVLNAGRGYRGFPYINGRYSVPDTGYGS